MMPTHLALLEEMASGSIERLEPFYDPDDSRIRCPDAETLIQISDESVITALESLVKQGFVSKEFREGLFICPDCGFNELRLKTICVECGSEDTVKRDFIEHIECGCVEPETEFETAANTYVCPECGDELGSSGSDYRVRKNMHLCRACSELYDTIEYRMTCSHPPCNDYTLSELSQISLYDYMFNEENMNELETIFKIREIVAEYLEERGFTVAIDTAVTDESGDRYPIHLHALDDELPIEVVCCLSEEPTADDVTEIAALASKTDTQPVLATIATSVKPNVTNLMDERNVGMITVREEEKATIDEEELDDQQGETKEEKTTTDEEELDDQQVETKEEKATTDEEELDDQQVETKEEKATTDEEELVDQQVETDGGSILRKFFFRKKNQR
jgi:hypothetical protein